MIVECFKKNLIIESPRMILRPIKKSDVDDIFEIYSDVEMMQHHHLPALKTMEEAQNLTKSFIKGQNDKTMLKWAMELKENGKVVGNCGFSSFSEKDKKVQLDFDMSGKLKGRGLMREALLMILTFAFTRTDINRVEMLLESSDLRAQTLIKKLCFKKEGEMRQYKMRRGELVDMTLWGLLKMDFPLELCI